MAVRDLYQFDFHEAQIFHSEPFYLEVSPRACLKIHSSHLHAPLCGIFGSHSVDGLRFTTVGAYHSSTGRAAPRYAALIRVKSPTNCIAHLAESIFQTRSKNVDKAYGLKYLLRLLDISREKMICFGDGYNDIRMLQYAGAGVAMKNAPEKVKMVADFITEEDNDHDGIAGMINRFFPKCTA